jgi:DNA-binding GntR family transcriptional regulator
LKRNKELLSEKVYRVVRKMISVHRLQPGLHLNAEKIARELGVSRIPVWEAIRRLQQEGIVRTIPNRGAFLLENPLERTIETIEVRGALDKLAGRLACERISDRILEQLAQCLHDQLQAIETADLGLYSSTDLRFHGLIYEASGNSYLKEMFESITLQMLPARVEWLRILPSLYMDHQEIVEGLAHRDQARVDAVITRHGELAMNHVKGLLQSANERKEMVRRIRKNFSPLKALPKGTGSRKQKLDLLSNPGRKPKGKTSSERTYARGSTEG